MGRTLGNAPLGGCIAWNRSLVLGQRATFPMSSSSQQVHKSIHRRSNASTRAFEQIDDGVGNGGFPSSLKGPCEVEVKPREGRPFPGSDSATSLIWGVEAGTGHRVLWEPRRPCAAILGDWGGFEELRSPAGKLCSASFTRPVFRPMEGACERPSRPVGVASAAT